MRCVSRGYSQAVVVADQDDPDNQLIYAFVVSSVPLNLAALMDALSKNLPGLHAAEPFVGNVRVTTLRQWQVLS